MSTTLGPLYHWSPRDRRKSIDRYGLKPGHRSPRARKPDPDDDELVRGWYNFRADYVCFSTTPATAWAYCLPIRGVTYDLWEIYLQPTDEVHILPMWGDLIIEVRVMNRIPKSRLVFVGERTAEKGREPHE